MERIDCIADPVALLWGLVLAHVAGASRVLAVVGALRDLGASLSALPLVSVRPVRVSWRSYSTPRAADAAA